MNCRYKVVLSTKLLQTTRRVYRDYSLDQNDQRLDQIYQTTTRSLIQYVVYVLVCMMCVCTKYSKHNNNYNNTTDNTTIERYLIFRVSESQ